jgi:hypothetical protein
VLAEDRPARVGWLHYRLAVAFCATIAMATMLLIVPGIILLVGPSTPSYWNLYPYAFSKWGAAILVATALFGFAAGGERTANLFAFLWGTHPLWSRLEEWLYQHETAAAALGWLLVLLLVGGFWYAAS